MPFAVFGPYVDPISSFDSPSPSYDHMLTLRLRIIARSFISNTSSRWRWSYYLGDIFGTITLFLYHFLYHPPKYSQLHVAGKTKWEALKEMDFGGIFLFVSGCVLFLIGLSWGGTAYPWTSPQTLCTLILGLATLASFVIYGMWDLVWLKLDLLY